MNGKDELISGGAAGVLLRGQCAGSKNKLWTMFNISYRVFQADSKALVVNHPLLW